MIISSCFWLILHFRDNLQLLGGGCLNRPVHFSNLSLTEEGTRRARACHVSIRLANIQATGKDRFTWTSFDDLVDVSIKEKLIDNLLTSSVLLRNILLWTFIMFWQNQTRNYSLWLLLRKRETLHSKSLIRLTCSVTKWI